MKIALVFDKLGFGGIERVGCNYAKIFINLGYEVTVYNLTPNMTELECELPPEAIIRHFSLKRNFIPERYSILSKFFSWGKFVFPVIYILLSIGLCIKKLFVRDNVTYDVVIAFAGHYNDLTFVANNFLKSKKKLCWLHGALIEYLAVSDAFFRFYQKIKNCCVLTESMQNAILARNKPLKKINIKKIYNATFIDIDNDNTCNIEEELSKYGDYILMVARFDFHQKDQKTVIDAFEILKTKYHRTEKLLFVGDGVSFNHNKAYAKSKTNIADDIVFIGSKINVKPYFKKAKIFVHSSHFEGLPTVFIEALTLGTPIVAGDGDPGVSEVLSNGKYGLVCEPQNPNDMAEKIEYLLTNEKIRNEYIEKGKQRAKDFLPQKIEKEIKKILENLI